MEARNRQLQEWFSEIREGTLVLPRFQRFEAWSLQNVATLLNTILQGLPVGSLLVYRAPESDAFVCRPLAGVTHPASKGADYLLDGQQRLTALWRSLHNNYENRRFFLCMEKDEETGLPYYVDSEALHFNKKTKKWYPEWVKDPVQLWKQKRIPLEVFCPGTEGEDEFSKWLEKCEGDKNVIISLSKLRTTIASYKLPYLSLSDNTPKHVALDVFIKMNTTAAPLTTYDIVVAQVEAQIDQSLHELVGDIRESTPEIESYAKPEDLILNTSAYLQEKSPSNSNFLQMGFAGQMIANWDILVSGIRKAIAFLEEERIFDAQRLPSEVILPVICALWARAPEYGDREGQARSLMRRYIWRAFFTDRYERTTTSRSLTDYRQVLAAMNGSSEKPVIFNDAEHPLPVIDELINAGWPTRKDRLSRAILALSLRSGGLDLADGSAVTRENLLKREYHHLFPNARLKKAGRSEKEIFRSLNNALVTWKTNRTISDKEPEHYLAERRDGTNLGEVELRYRLNSHIIPYDEMIAGDYDAFINKRAEMITKAMQSISNGESI